MREAVHATGSRKTGASWKWALAALAITVPTAGASAEPLIIESWRNDDLTIWEDVIIPAFNAQHPDIEVVFAPTAPAEYNAALNAKLAGGTAGDLITCRPFDASLALFLDGHLASLNGLDGMENFSGVAKSAWVTDDGSTVFCLPMASVIHGFIYNKEAFDELGLSEPATVSEFYDVLEAIKDDGSYAPLAMGTADQWESATMGFQNIGPNYWAGEEGRLAVIAGSQKLSDAPYVETFAELAKWQPYMPRGYQAQTYPDSQNLFSLGRAAIYPAGSWTSTCSTARPISSSPPSRHRCRTGRAPATSATTPTSRWGSTRPATRPTTQGPSSPGWPVPSSPSSTPTPCPGSSRCRTIRSASRIRWRTSS